MPNWTRSVENAAMSVGSSFFGDTLTRGISDESRVQVSVHFVMVSVHSLPDGADLRWGLVLVPQHSARP